MGSEGKRRGKLPEGSVLTLQRSTEWADRSSRRLRLILTAIFAKALLHPADLRRPCDRSPQARATH